MPEVPGAREAGLGTITSLMAATLARRADGKQVWLALFAQGVAASLVRSSVLSGVRVGVLGELFAGAFIDGLELTGQAVEVHRPPGLVGDGRALEDEGQRLAAQHLAHERAELTGVDDLLGKLVGPHAGLLCAPDDRVGELGLPDLQLLLAG